MPYKIKRLEQQQGKPIREILIEAFNLGRTQEKMAKRLGVTPGTLAKYMAIARLRIEPVLIDEENHEVLA